MEPDWITDLRKQLPAIPFVSVFGSSAIGDEDPRITPWREIARILAANGVGLLNGGYQGTMSFLAQEIRIHGGVSIGITSREARGVTSPACFSMLLEVPTLFQRLEALLRLANFYVVLPGGLGTLAETACAAWLIDRALVPFRPIVFLGETWTRLMPILASDPLMLTSRYFDGNDLFIEIATPEHLESTLLPILRSTSNASLSR
jgi:uncharacterized protein (TIGR00725 family)